jgi:NADPH-dependent F420 reductase
MLAILGGTGPEGKGLALRLAMAGEEVLIGSRDATRASDAAEALKELAPNLKVTGDVNDVAAQQGDVVFLTVPYEGQASLLQQVAPALTGKIVVNVVAPMVFNRGRARAIQVEDGSAAEESQKILPESQVVAALQNLSAEDLMQPDLTMESDVVVCSDHREAKEQVMAMVERIPDLRAIDGGALEYARYVEQLTALLVNINRIYRCHSTIKIVGP